MVELTTTFLLASLFLFQIGVIAGWLISRRNVDRTDKSKLQVVIGALVTAIWVVSIVAEIIIPAYTVSILVHGIMGAVVGYLFSEDGVTINIGGSD